MQQREAMMEIARGQVRPVYLVYGGEPFLESEFLKAVYATVVRPETEAFNYHALDAGQDQVRSALSLAQTMPFFDQRRLVVARDCSIFQASRKKQAETEGDAADEKSGGDPAVDALLTYLQKPVESTVLVFTCSGSVDSRKKITKAVMATGGVVECSALNPADATMWTQDRAGQYQKKIGGDAARILVEKVGTDLRSLDSELKKLSLYAEGAREITVTHVNQAVGGTAETEIFRLTEAIILKQQVKAMQFLASALRQVDHPLQVLAAITNQFRLLLLIQGLVGRGVSLKDGPSIAKIHPYRYQILSKEVRRFSQSELTHVMERLLEADIAMKSGFDARLTLEMLVAELTAA